MKKHDTKASSDRTASLYFLHFGASELDSVSEPVSISNAWEVFWLFNEIEREGKAEVADAGSGQ
jgi:hypothetical protein